MSQLPTTDSDNREVAVVGRAASLAELQLNPQSLVGSYCHKIEGQDTLAPDASGVITWQGCVVAEPAPGVCLVELDNCLPGARRAQLLVELRQMVGDPSCEWRFYDTEEQMRLAFVEFDWT